VNNDRRRVWVIGQRECCIHVLEESAFAGSGVPDYDQTGRGGVEGPASGFTESYDHTVFLSVDNEITLLVTAATDKWIFEGYDSGPSSGKSSGS
jgi:hypothetical protein